MRSLNKVILMITIPLLSACSANINDYREELPRLELDTFFNGQLVAYGMVQDFKGKVTRRFKADIVGQWQGNHGVLDEHFEFSDGELQSRCWQLTKSGNQYTGRAGDVVGDAVGETSGNALNWKYVLQVPVDGKTWNLKIDDWLYLVDENNLINRSNLYKFGLKVGQITLSIHKIDDQPRQPLSPDCQLEES